MQKQRHIAAAEREAPIRRVLPNEMHGLGREGYHMQRKPRCHTDALPCRSDNRGTPTNRRHARCHALAQSSMGTHATDRRGDHNSTIAQCLCRRQPPTTTLHQSAKRCCRRRRWVRIMTLEHGRDPRKSKPEQDTSHLAKGQPHAQITPSRVRNSGDPPGERIPGTRCRVQIRR